MAHLEVGLVDVVLRGACLLKLLMRSSYPRRRQRTRAWTRPAIAKHTAPENVPQLTSSTLIASEVAGRMNAASPARKKSTDPTWLITTIHQSVLRGSTRTRP